MGFWHTGYMEFHESIGLGEGFEPQPERFSCTHCGEAFTSKERLREHRFSAHPVHRPVMFLHGRELGAHPVRITRQISPNDVHAEICNAAKLNGEKVPVNALPAILAAKTRDYCKVTLFNEVVASEFLLDFRVASEEDLKGIEDQFYRIARNRRLDTRAIDEFIGASAGYRSASEYCDGICLYLYGVLAKEGAPDTNLDYDDYLGKFNGAVEELASYDRPLSRTIVSLIEFHFNHFRDSARISPSSRVGRVAERYADWLDASGGTWASPIEINAEITQYEALVTEWETEKIVRWATTTIDKLFDSVEEMEAFLAKCSAEFDRVKMHILLGEAYASMGYVSHAREHARALRNLLGFEKWAERLIERLGDSGHE